MNVNHLGQIELGRQTIVKIFPRLTYYCGRSIGCRSTEDHSSACRSETADAMRLAVEMLSTPENLLQIMTETHVDCLVEWDRVSPLIDHVSYVSRDKMNHFGRNVELLVCDFRAKPNIHAMFLRSPFPHWELIKVTGFAPAVSTGQICTWDYQPGEELPPIRCTTCGLHGWLR